MSVDVFGRLLVDKKEIIKGPPGNGFELTNDGHFDIQNKKICHVADPVDPTDATNLKTLLEKIKDIRNIVWKLEKRINNIEEKMNIDFVFKIEDSIKTNRSNLKKDYLDSFSSKTNNE